MANPPKQDTEFKRFAAKRIIIGLILAVAVLWTLGGLMGIIERPEPIPQSALGGAAQEESAADETGDHTPVTVAANLASHGSNSQEAVHAASGDAQAAGTGDEKAAAPHATAPPATASHATASHATASHATASHATASHAATADTETAHAESADAAATTKESSAHETAHGDTQADADAAHGATPDDGHESAVSEAIAPKLPEHKEKGVATVEAIIAPIEFEIEERFWGWRPNDLINLTDNVNYYQLGVLEVTRRAVVALSERISRTGTTDAFNPNLEDATNWFMIKATKYWFPSAESKYNEGIKDLKKYRDALQGKRATFYTRTDNLIPLLASFEDLLGSCDENLVKHLEEDGSEVSWFKADNYFYYAKGVAAAMAPILEAVHHDFLITLETRHGIELLHHAVESCHTAAVLDPWLITDSELDGILANHRANLAAPISHARFFLGVLIKALST
jgi:hypothetical protein